MSLMMNLRVSTFEPTTTFATHLQATRSGHTVRRGNPRTLVGEFLTADSGDRIIFLSAGQGFA